MASEHVHNSDPKTLWSVGFLLDRREVNLSLKVHVLGTVFFRYEPVFLKIYFGHPTVHQVFFY